MSDEYDLILQGLIEDLVVVQLCKVNLVILLEYKIYIDEEKKKVYSYERIFNNLEKFI